MNLFTSLRFEPEPKLDTRKTDARLEIMVLGDESVGKSCLLSSFQTDAFPEHGSSMSSFVHKKKLNIEKRNYTLYMTETSSYEKFSNSDSRRREWRNFAHCYVICFNLNNPSSFISVETIWIPAVRHYAPKAPLILVGTKKDLILDGTKGFLSQEEIEGLKTRFHANAYIECSAKSLLNVNEVLEEAVRAAAICRATTYRTKCSLL